MSERERLHPSLVPSYGTTDGDFSSAVEVTFENPHIQASEGFDSSKSTTVTGTSTKLLTSRSPESNSNQIMFTPTTDSHHPQATNVYRGSGAVCQATESTPGGEMVTPRPPISHSTPDARSSGNRKVWKRHWRHFACAALVIGGIAIAIPPIFVWMAHSSSNTQVFAGDVVQVSSVKLFWFNQVSVRQQPPEGAEQAEAIIYKENCASKERLNKTDFTSRPLLYTAPQGLYNLQQQYLLAESDLTINLTIQAHSDSDSSAKVCQYSNVNAYDELLNSDTKAEVDEAEKDGFCQQIEPPSDLTPHTTLLQFNIHSHGYYYYALAIVPGKQVNISYNYTLRKQYYDKDKLTPYNCSVVDHECTINGFTKITAENCILTFIPPPAAIEPLTPYTFLSEQRVALGIEFTYLCIASSLVLVCVIFVCCNCVYYKRKSPGHTGGVV